MSTNTRDSAHPFFGMTDLEERIRDDGEVRAAVLSRLAQLYRDIDAMVGHGLTRDEFQRARVLQGAVVAARNFLTVRTRASSQLG